MLALLLPAAAAAGATLCVKPGAGGDCGSPDCSRCDDTIGAALTAALAGDTVRVAAATYLENLTIDKNVIVEGGWSTDFSTRDPAVFESRVEPADNTTSVVAIMGTFGNSAASTPVFDGFTVTAGRADLGGNHGGGVRVRDSDATVSNNRIVQNQAFLLGGGVWVQRGAPTLRANLIEDNVAGGQAGSVGGGVMLEATTGAQLIDNLISDNVITMDQGFGGGVGVQSGSAVLSGNTISGNQAEDQGFGGGVGAGFAARVEIQGGAIENNNPTAACATNASSRGGGIAAQNADSITVEAVRIEGNCGPAGGGGLYVVDTPVYSVVNAIFSGNDGGGNGEALLNDSATGDADLTHNTFVGAGAGIGVATPGDLVLVNNIVTGFATGVQVSATATVVVAGNDFFDNTQNMQNFTPDPATNLFVDPMLDGSFHLSAGSPMIDAGTLTNATFSDIDGDPRPADGGAGRFRFDIGADEVPGPAQDVIDLERGPADLTINGTGNPGGNQNTDWIGYAVAGADVTGDGLDDLVFSAQDYAVDFDNNVFANGRAFSLFHFGTRRLGTIELLTEPADLELISLLTNWHVGESLAVADLNDDLTGDLIVGAGVQDDGDNTIVPTVIVFFGGAGLNGALEIDAADPGDVALLGQGGNGAGLGGRNGNGLGAAELSGDGVADLFAGEPGADVGGTSNAGAVHVMFGGTGLSGTRDLAATPADFTLVGPADDAQLGAAAAGRLNADAQPDLVARTPTTAYVLFGPLAAGVHTLADTPADATVSGLDGSLFFEQVLVGDASGDGIDDLMLASGDATGQDRLLIFFGPLASGQALAAGAADAILTLHEDISSLAFDSALIVGSRNATEAYVVTPGEVPAGETPIAEVASLRVFGPSQRQLGWDVDAGDLDGDGQPDLIVGTWQLEDPSVSMDNNDIDIGRVFVFYGGAVPDNCPAVASADRRDTDGDGVGDVCDNCRLLANAPQRDTDGDGFGNRCDADLNNDGIVDDLDLGIMKTRFYGADPHADLDGDGRVNFIDLGLLKSLFLAPPGPGPSAGAAAGSRHE